MRRSGLDDLPFNTNSAQRQRGLERKLLENSGPISRAPEARRTKKKGYSERRVGMEQAVKSAVLKEYGDHDNVEVEHKKLEGPLESNEVEVEVECCGLNFADVYTRRGLINRCDLPIVLGLECSGVVVRVGTGIYDVQVGDRVVVHTGYPGLFADRVRVKSHNCYKLPPMITLEHASALTISYLTAYFCLFDIGNLREGQIIFIPSAAGGMGWAATQLAKTRAGVKVIGSASVSKHELIRANGVDIAIDSRSSNWDEVVRQACPGGVDIALDITAGDNFRKTRSVLNHLGKAIIIGANVMMENQEIPETDSVEIMELILNSQSVAGFHLTRLKEKLPKRFKDVLEVIFALYEGGVVKPRIDSTWPMERVMDAIKRLERRENVGKVLLLNKHY